MTYKLTLTEHEIAEIIEALMERADNHLLSITEDTIKEDELYLRNEVRIIDGIVDKLRAL